MAYYERIVTAGRSVEHRKEFTNRVHTKGAQRRPHSSPTPQGQAQINERVAEENLRWAINGNFGYMDFHIVLHFCRKGIGFMDLLEYKRRFLAKLRKECRRRKIAYKAIVVMETKHMTNPHIHVVLTKMDPEVVQGVWADIPPGGGRVSFQYLDKRGNHYKLARYLIKESRETMTYYSELGIRGKRYTATQNLTKPKIRYRRVSAGSWRKDPVARKGMYLYKFDDGATCKSGWHEVSGWPYQEYFEVLNE